MFKILPGVFLLGLLFTSCDKEDEGPENYFTVGQETYEISYGLLENWGRQVDDLNGQDWNYEGYNLDLTFCTEGLGLREGEYEMEHTGTGQMLYFEILNANGTSLENGTYYFDEDSDPSKVKTFDYASYSNYYDEDVEDNDWIWITAGKITVKKSGSQYEIEVDCTDEYDNKVTGVFKGNLDYYDYVVGLRSATSIKKMGKK